MNGGVPRPDVLRNREERGVVLWKSHNTLWWDGDVFWYAQIGDFTGMQTMEGRYEYLVDLQVEMNERKPSIRWYLRFQVSKRVLGDRQPWTGRNEKDSGLSLRVKANHEGPSLVDVELTHEGQPHRSQATCSGASYLWRVTQEAAEKWLKAQGGRQGIARSLLERDLNLGEADVFDHQVLCLLKGICAEGGELQKQKALHVENVDQGRQ